MRTDRRFDASPVVGHGPSTAQRRQAVLVVAAHATDAADLSELLAMLGLAPEEGRPPVDPPAEPEPVHPAPALPPQFMTELAELAARAHRTSTPDRVGGAR